MKPGIGTHIHKQTPLLQSIESISLSHLPTNQPTYLTSPTCIAQPVRGPSHYRCISSPKINNR